MNKPNSELIIKLENVSRIFPRDINQIPTQIIKEMLFPFRETRSIHLDHIYALKEVSFELKKGEILGVLATHMSGKSTLARMAAGILEPTSGHIIRNAKATLLSKSTSGFKPTLSLRENLKIRGVLDGVQQSQLDDILHESLVSNRINPDTAKTPIGNLSPYLIKKVSLSFLLGLPNDFIVLDDLPKSSIGDSDSYNKRLLEKKISDSTALIIGSSLKIIQEYTDQLIILDRGVSHGPFKTNTAAQQLALVLKDNEAIGYHEMIDEEYVDEDLQMQSPQLRSFDIPNNYEIENEPDNLISKSDIKKSFSPLMIIKEIYIDGIIYSHKKVTLVRSTSQCIFVELIIRFHNKTHHPRFELCLHSEMGEEFACKEFDTGEIVYNDDEDYVLSFSFITPESPPQSIGVSLTPIEFNLKKQLKDRQKVLTYIVPGTARHRTAISISDIQIHHKQ